MKYLFLIALAVSCFSCHRIATVTKILDGDTFVIQSGEHIRMAEIDSPEYSQEYGKEARAALANLIEGKTVELRKTDRDKYGRLVCEVYCNGIWINREMVRNGFAWAYKRYSSPQLHLDELTARNLKKGLWAKEGAQAPIIYRHNHK